MYLIGSLTWDSTGWALAIYKGTLAPGSGTFAFTGSGAELDWDGSSSGRQQLGVRNERGRSVRIDGSSVWIGCDGGVFQSGSSGAAGSFSAKNAGLSITQITYFSVRADSADELYAGCQDNGTLHYVASNTPPWSQSEAEMAAALRSIPTIPPR